MVTNGFSVVNDVKLSKKDQLLRKSVGFEGFSTGGGNPAETRHLKNFGGAGLTVSCRHSRAIPMGLLQCDMIIHMDTYP